MHSKKIFTPSPSSRLVKLRELPAGSLAYLEHSSHSASGTEYKDDYFILMSLDLAYCFGRRRGDTATGVLVKDDSRILGKEMEPVAPGSLFLMNAERMSPYLERKV